MFLTGYCHCGHGNDGPLQLASRPHRLPSQHASQTTLPTSVLWGKFFIADMLTVRSSATIKAVEKKGLSCAIKPSAGVCYLMAVAVVYYVGIIGE